MNRQFWNRNASTVLTCLGGVGVGWIANDDGKYWIEFDNREINIKGVDCILISMPFAPDLEWQEEY